MQEILYLLRYLVGIIICGVFMDNLPAVLFSCTTAFFLIFLVSILILVYRNGTNSFRVLFR